MRTSTLLCAPVCAMLVAACGAPREPEDFGAWFDEGSAYDVQEPIAFTAENYDFIGATAIADLPSPPTRSFQTWFAEADAPPTENCDEWSTVDTLPAEITGIVTIHPRFYIKVSGCIPPDDFDVDSDEKYFGSFFVQDRSGGHFVLGNSRVAHFSMGDRVTLRVRAIKEYFGSRMISAHDVVSVERTAEPIFYREVQGRLLDDGDLAEVVRVEGIVAGEMGQFGELYLCTGDDPDTTPVADQGRQGDIVPRCARSDVSDPPWYKVGIDVELQRRGVSYETGTRLQVTGPVHLSFGDRQVSVLRVGQLQPLD